MSSRRTTAKAIATVCAVRFAYAYAKTQSRTRTKSASKRSLLWHFFLQAFRQILQILMNQVNQICLTLNHIQKAFYTFNICKFCVLQNRVCFLYAFEQIAQLRLTACKNTQSFCVCWSCCHNVLLLRFRFTFHKVKGKVNFCYLSPVRHKPQKPFDFGNFLCLSVRAESNSKKIVKSLCPFPFSFSLWHKKPLNYFFDCSGFLCLCNLKKIVYFFVRKGNQACIISTNV